MITDPTVDTRIETESVIASRSIIHESDLICLFDRFWTEIYQGAKLFYLSGLEHEEYLKREVHNLGRFISVMKFNPVLVSCQEMLLTCDINADYVVRS